MSLEYTTPVCGLVNYSVIEVSKYLIFYLFMMNRNINKMGNLYDKLVGSTV